MLSWYPRMYRYSTGPVSILVFEDGRWKKLKNDAAGVGRGRDDIKSVTQSRPEKVYGVRTCWSMGPCMYRSPGLAWGKRLIAPILRWYCAAHIYPPVALRSRRRWRTRKGGGGGGGGSDSSSSPSMEGTCRPPVISKRTGFIWHRSCRQLCH